MKSMILKCSEGGNFEPHPEGVYPAVCVGLMDLGLVEKEYQGERSVKPGLKLTFESEETTKDGTRCTVSAKFTTSLHPKAKLTGFLGKWRGRPVLPGEDIDLSKLIGACCTLMISHQQNMVGRTYASIDAVSKPTKQVAPSGTYDPVAAQQRYDDWKAGNLPAGSGVSPQTMAVEPRPGTGVSPGTNPNHGSASTTTVAQRQPPAAPAGEAEDNVPFDPEVGF